MKSTKIVKGGKIITGNGTDIKRGVVIVEGAQIAAVCRESEIGIPDRERRRIHAVFS